MLFGTWRRRFAGAGHCAAGPHGIDALLDADLNDQAERLAQAMIDLLVSVTATSPVLWLGVSEKWWGAAYEKGETNQSALLNTSTSTALQVAICKTSRSLASEYTSRRSSFAGVTCWLMAATWLRPPARAMAP